MEGKAVPPESQVCPQQSAPRLDAARVATALGQGGREIFCSIFPPRNEAWLAQARLELYWNGTRFNMLIMPVAALLVTIAMSPWVALRTRALWWFAVAAVSFGTQYAGQMMFRGGKAPTLAVLRLRSVALVALITLFFCAWCSMAVWLWVPGVLIDHMMLILLLACSLAGCIAVTSMHPALAASAVLVHGAFLIGPTATSHDGLERTLAALATAFTIMIAVQGVALCLRSTKMLRLEHEHEGLVQELRAAKEESDRAKARAVQAGQARSQFFSHMNHELRTPMNAILGFSEMIHNKAFGQNVDRYAEYAGIIHESGTTLLTLIDNVLNLSKIQNGQMYLRESDIDLCVLLRSGMEQYEVKAAEAGVVLVLEAPRGLPLVRGDERALRQVLVNLLSNAIKFTPAGGRVDVFAQMEADDRIAFGVEDTGSGIELEDQDDVFERFGFGRHDVTTADRGTGLGLAIVKGFTEAHDGEVQLESAPGRGTRVTVYMPAYRVIAPGALKTA